MGESERLIESSEELWARMVAEGGLRLRSYDKDVANELRSRLGLKGRESFTTLLKRGNVPTERLVAEFFAVGRPFTQMFEDILRLMAAIGRTEAKGKLDLQFDFDTARNVFKCDLDAFRKEIEKFRDVTRPVTVEEWNYDYLWGVSGALADPVGDSVPGQVDAWAAEYMSGVWPTQDVEPPSTGDPEFDRMLDRVWAFRRAVLDAARSFGPRREDLRGGRGRRSRTFTVEDGRVVGDAEDLKELLALVDGDHWFRMITLRTHATAEAARTDPQHAPVLRGELKAFLDEVPQRITEVQDRIADVLEFLRLPIWKQRYELYSVWVFTQIVEALGGAGRFDFTVNENGTFHIPFAPRRLATLKRSEPPIHVCSEIRYELLEPVGKGRVAGMQPDFSLTTDPGPEVKDSFALVECKQYISEARHKFGDAIHDYAKGQPGAAVVLAAYGPATAGVLNYVPKEYHPRTHIFGHLQPGMPENARRFREAVLEIAEGHSVPYPAPATDRSPGHPRHRGGEPKPDAKEVIEGIPQEVFQKKVEDHLKVFRGVPEAENVELAVGLYWKRLPKDLDLHVIVSGEGADPVHIHYLRKGSLTEGPWAELRSDVTNGEGPEFTLVRKEAGTRCGIFVHAFTEEVQLQHSGAVVLVAARRGRCVPFGCDGLGEGGWWHVADFDLVTGELIEVAVISPARPFDTP